MNAGYTRLFDALVTACSAVYTERLVTVAIYGSVARGVARPDSDVDVLIVADPLPRGRLARVTEFESVEARLEGPLSDTSRTGIPSSLSPVFKSPAEAEHGSPLFLDMTEHVILLFDKNAFFAGRLERLKARMLALGSVKLPYRGGYYWLLKPDYKPGDVIEL